MNRILEGRVAIVTGAGRGIGREHALELARQGAKVVVNDLGASAGGVGSSAGPANEVVGLIQQMGGEAVANGDDVADFEGAQRMVRQAVDTFGGLDILVNNAGTNPYFGPTLGVDPPRYDKTFEVNVRGPLFWSQQAWDRAFQDHPGVIINIASVGGVRVDYGLGVYNVTKAALIHLTKQLAAELGPTRVVGIAPGLIDTDFSSLLVENFGDALVASMPTKRLGEPEDIAHLAVFLASDKASWITGETFVVDGGAGVAFRR